MENRQGRISRPILTAILVLLLAACGGATDLPAPTAPPPTRALPPTTTPRPPRPTPAPSALPTSRPTRPAEPTATPRPTAEPTVPPSPAAGPFVVIPPAAGWLEGNVVDLRIDPDGAAWLVTERGVGRWQDGAWALLREEPGTLAGFDDGGLAWWIPAERDEILSWDGTDWTAYGPATGWTPLQDPGQTTVASDRRGWVWLVDREAVYTLDGPAWTVLPYDQIGFVRDPMDEEYEGFHLTEVIRDGEGDIWVSNCNTYGESTGGQGVRWFDGERWGGADSPITGAGCVHDLELDAQGRLWLSAGHDLARYTPGQGWQEYGAPDMDPAWGSFMGAILAFAVSPQGEPWAYFDICGGASCGNVQKLFYLRGERWTWAGDCNWDCRWDHNIAFAPDGAAWFFASYEPSDDPAAPRSGIYRLEGDAPELVAPFWHCDALAVDGAGRVWVVPSYGLPDVYLYERPAGTP